MIKGKLTEEYQNYTPVELIKNCLILLKNITTNWWQQALDYAKDKFEEYHKQ